MTSQVEKSLTLKEFSEIVNSAEGKPLDDETAGRLRKYLVEHPEVYDMVGRVAYVTAEQMLTHMVKHDGLRIAISEEMELMRDNLGYASAAPIERMMIDHIVMCWVRLQLVEMEYTEVIVRRGAVKYIEHVEKRLNAAQRRYIRATEASTRIRKLISQTPALQVNIANQQIVANK